MVNKMEKAIVIWSGGMDSTTLVWDLKDKFDLYTLSFNYGQKHKKELNVVKKLSKIYNIKNIQIDLREITPLISSSSLTSDKEVPHGMYNQENMIQTVVPARNLIMLSVASGYAINNKINYVFYAPHAGDHAIYDDCREEFINSLNTTINEGYKSLFIPKIIAPFLKITKSEILEIGLGNNTPYKYTWSCYEGKNRPCLKCGTCVERTEAFIINENKDPSLTKKEWKEAIEIYNNFKK